MTNSVFLLLLACAYILFPVGLLLEAFRRPYTRFAQRGGHFFALPFAFPGLLILVMTLRTLQVEADIAALRQRAGLTSTSPLSVDAWVAWGMLVFVSAAAILVATELLLLLHKRLARPRLQS